MTINLQNNLKMKLRIKLLITTTLQMRRLMENGNTIKTVIIITMMIIVCVSLVLSASVFAESGR